MKKYVVLLAILFILPSIFAVDLTVNKKSSDESMVLGLNQPAIFDLDITNNGPADSFKIYTYFGGGYIPQENFQISSGETKNIQFEVSPPYDISRTGFTLFDYFIQGSDGSKYTDKLLVNVVDLNEVFEIGSGEIYPESNSIEIYVKNKINFNFPETNAYFSSPFFELGQSFSLGPKEKKVIKINLDKEDYTKLTAGFYTLTADIKIGNKTSNVQGIINFKEKESLIENEDKYGLVIRTNVITKSNEGNVAKVVNASVDKNIISRLFTSFNPEPDDVFRDGTKIHYSWTKELNPGEKLEIKVKTNWLLPLLFIFFIVASVVFVKEYTKTTVKLRKKITFVKSKGGEFALKVSLVIHAKKRVENVLLIERIPALVKLYKKFGKEQPVRINEKAKKIEWQFNKLEAGERRMITYVVYSKVGVIGRFALPRAVAIYEKNGKMEESNSNKVFFLNEKIQEQE